jgi:hypothetical protein
MVGPPLIAQKVIVVARWGGDRGGWGRSAEEHGMGVDSGEEKEKLRKRKKL